jgi:hypothetical protein
MNGATVIPFPQVPPALNDEAATNGWKHLAQLSKYPYPYIEKLALPDGTDIGTVIRMPDGAGISVDHLPLAYACVKMNEGKAATLEEALAMVPGLHRYKEIAHLGLAAMAMPVMDWNYPEVHQLIRDNIRVLCSRFFPHGKLLNGHEWAVGSVAGDPGESLKIELNDPVRAGMFKDWATDDKGTFLDLLKLSRNFSLDQAVMDVCATLGVPFQSLLNYAANPADQYKQRAGTASQASAAVDWSPYKLTHLNQISELASWRGYSVEFCQWAADRDYIGRDKGRWVTPVIVNGVLAAIHKRLSDGNWIYEPSGNGAHPLIAGDLTSAQAGWIEESQWDTFAALDAHGIQHGVPIVGIATRGANNAKLIKEVQFAGQLYTCGQNDAAGKKWLDELAAIRPFKHVPIPTQFKDLNDWLKAGGEKDFIAAFNGAKDYRAAASVLIEFLTPSEIKAYKLPAGVVIAGDNHIIRGEPFVLGGEPGVGKSRVTVGLAEAGATGYEWLGLKIHCRFSIAIIQTQNGRFRLQQEFANLDETVMDKYVRISPPPPRGLCFGRQEFREQLKRFFEVFQPGVVILDPWSAVARDDKQKDYLESFELVQETMPDGDLRPALGIVAHTHKPTANDRANRGRNLLNMLSGSLVLGSVPRTVWVLQHASNSVNETRVVVTCCKNNNGELGDRTVWERGNGLWSPVTGFDWDAFDNVSQPGPSKKGPVITEQTMAEVFNFGYTALTQADAIAALEALTGCSQPTCYRAFNRHKHRLSYNKTTKLYSWRK